MAASIPPIIQLARVPGRIPGSDVAIAAGMLVWALLEALLAQGPGSTATRVLLAAGFALPLAARRQWPIRVLLVVGVFAIVRGWIGGVDEEGAMPFPALLLAGFSAALYAPRRWLAWAAAPVPIVAIAFAGFGDLEYAPATFIALTAWASGWLIHRRAEQLAQARAQGPELAREAVTAERARMARELHDVVAHSITVVSVQAGAAQGLADRDPATARRHLQSVRESAHEALVELRRLVGVLREDEPTYAPQPGLAGLGELLAESRAAGLPVELSEHGVADTIPAGLDLNAYRIVQESLTNVRRHAGTAPAHVLISYFADRLELEVTNTPGGQGALGPGGGHGLIGMRERARLYGGTLHAGPTPDGGYRVHASLPVPSSAPPGEAVAAPHDRPPNRDAAAEPVRRLALVPRRIPPVDLAIAAGLLAWALFEAFVTGRPVPVATGVLTAVGFALPMVVRRRWPVLALAAVCVLMIVAGATLDGYQEGSSPFAVLLLASFSVGLYAPIHPPVVAGLALAVAAVVTSVSYDVDRPAPAVDVAIMSALAGGAWAAGVLIRRRAQQVADAQAKSPELAREAVAAERARMARELHDIVAHSVTIVSVQAGAAEELLDRAPARARGHIESVQEGAREALVELRRLVGVLREDGPAYTPQPGLGRLGELITEHRAAGLPVELSLDGEQRRLPAGLELTAYRIAQESLTNVRRHAGSAQTRVLLRYRKDRLELEIANGPGRRNGSLDPGSGHGLIGMRERARLYGATLLAGPTPEGGFVVHVNLPIDSPSP